METLVQLSLCPFVCSHVPGITDISVNDIYGDIEVQCKAVAVWQKVFDFITESENGQAHRKCASCKFVDLYMTWINILILILMHQILKIMNSVPKYTKYLS